MRNLSSFSTDGISGKRVRLFTAIFILMVGIGCSNRALYESQRTQRLQECYREYEGTQREQCIEANEADYAEYERQRKDALESP
jgi:hypothetical protein